MEKRTPNKNPETYEPYDEDDPNKSPSCVQESEYYYPGCFKKYRDAFIQCESDSECVGVIRHNETIRVDSDDGPLNHAPEGYYVCRHNFTISQNFFVLAETPNEPNRPKPIYKKKNGKGMHI